MVVIFLKMSRVFAKTPWLAYFLSELCCFEIHKEQTNSIAIPLLLGQFKNNQ